MVIYFVSLLLLFFQLLNIVDFPYLQVDIVNIPFFLSSLASNIFIVIISIVLFSYYHYYHYFSITFVITNTIPYVIVNIP